MTFIILIGECIITVQVKIRCDRKIPLQEIHAFNTF